MSSYDSLPSFSFSFSDSSDELSVLSSQWVLFNRVSLILYSCRLVLTIARILFADLSCLVLSANSVGT